MVREGLAWLFRAEFADGSVIQQDQDDRCQTRDDGTGSAYTDVRTSPERLVAFHLANGEELVSVDLLTGTFVVNGTPVHAHGQYFDPMAHELELVYFRECRVEQTTDAEGATVGERHYTNRYFVGWKVNGTTVTLAVG